MTIKLVSSIQIDVGYFPLRLPMPDGVNNGGYCVPTPQGSLYIYSQIDLLVAGLEAVRLGIEISNLTAFFAFDRIILSEFQIPLAVDIDGVINYRSIAMWKAVIKESHDHGLLKVMNKNAPLTFKWVNL